MSCVASAKQDAYYTVLIIPSPQDKFTLMYVYILQSEFNSNKHYIGATSSWLAPQELLEKNDWRVIPQLATIARKALPY
jgi:hypothetical protein